MKLSPPPSLAQVLADAENADILRQLGRCDGVRRTLLADSQNLRISLRYDKYGRGERIHQCIICKGGQLCEVRAG